MLGTSFSSDSLNGSSSSAIFSPSPAAYPPSSLRCATPVFHCSAGGITWRSQMYSPSTRSRFFAPSS